MSHDIDRYAMIHQHNHPGFLRGGALLSLRCFPVRMHPGFVIYWRQNPVIGGFFSPVMMMGVFRLPLVVRGKMLLSASRSPSTPITRHSGSTTASGSSLLPIRAVPQGWNALSACSRIKLSSAEILPILFL